VCAGIHWEGAGLWQGSPSPSRYSVGIHGCLLVGGGGIWILSINKQNKLRKIWIFSVLSFLYDFLSLENDVSVSSKRNKHENLEKKIIFC
jgi:hypothetical protein